MNFDGYSPHEINRFSSLVEQDDPTNLPLGVSALARNVRFHLTSVRTRDGLQNQYGFTLPDIDRVTGLGALKVGGSTGDLQVPIAFSALGNLYIESPAGSGHVVQISGPLVSLPASASMQVAAAFKNGYLAFTDLKNSKASPAVYNPILNTLDPLSMKQVGQLWTASTPYQVGEVVCPATPVGGNSHSYRCTVAGTSGAAQPAFPTTEGATVADGAVTWQENTPLMVQALPEPPIPSVARTPGAGTFAAGRDVYIIVTLVNGVGETDAQQALAFKFVNTVLNDRFVVTGPTLAGQALWVQALPAPYLPTGYNVYEADVATGGGAPALSAYKKVNGGTVALGVNTNVDTTGAGAAPPTTNGALVVPAGNICSGLRYMVVLFVNRNGYISGMTSAAVISYNSPTSGFKLFVAHIPKGPSNTIARICAFTPAGQLSQLAGTGISNAGPYFFIEPAQQYFVRAQGGFNLSNVPGGVTIADVVNGVQMTSTLINDNTSTTATFNFTDDYLKSTTNDVSAFFRKIQMPPCSDIWYSKTLRRMFYANDDIQSGWRVSLLGDPESVYGDSSAIVQVSENDGQNRTAVREFSGIIYVMKEKSGHVLTPSTDDPSKWLVVQQWEGSGPCGPRAVDVCGAFMAYVHRSGLWIFKGGQPFRVSKEIPITWSSINWAAQETIWVLIDDETQEIRIGVPTGQSIVPNIVLKLNYEESPEFASPIHFSPYIGKEIASGECYKWSIDDIAANVAIRAERTLVNPPKTLDLPTVQSQVLFASSNPDGHVDPIIPFQFDDNGVGIDSITETASPQDLLRPNQLGGVQANIDGYGQIQIEILALRAKDPKQGGLPTGGGTPSANYGFVKKLAKPVQAGVPYSCGVSGQNERFRARVSNNKQKGVWFDLKYLAIYAHPVSSARPR